MASSTELLQKLLCGIIGICSVKGPMVYWAWVLESN